MIEVVYQLFRHKDSLNLLLVAPSNDAADLLVEKLAPYFPPSEMKRIVAYSRSIEQVSPNARPYVKEGLTDKEMSAEIMTGRIIVSTVNLAARFFYYFGIPQGHFDVLCVDEAGHATEPEVVGVAASLMDFKRQDSRVGQLILAGDPRQLGPVVTSDLCERFGLDLSYMERLTKADVYSRGENGEYPEDLLTKLIRNYRSHPTILKLPNQMFYDNELLVCGDVLSTFSLARWEHLPQTGFPVIFHAVNGENLREGTSPSWFNPQEAEEVVKYVDLLINQSRPAMMPEDIGIITPYARQAQKIRLALKHRNFNDIKVGSVETFQGQERRCIIISTVRAETELLDHDLAFNLGFVANEKRFNVAVTRAKSLLVVIGNPRVLATDEKNWLPFLKFCKENSAWMGEPWNETEVGSLGLLSYGKTELSLDSILAETDDWLLLNGISDGEEKEERGFMNREE
jgi:helicase MOV-10